mmetsp:Transcript_31184/g.79497  ORF Transcript_31184/g.79497 Transcript_31184/m.79497 type:complete len:285 (-) Transcript_31184:30-884(-)
MQPNSEECTTGNNSQRAHAAMLRMFSVLIVAWACSIPHACGASDDALWRVHMANIQRSFGMQAAASQGSLHLSRRLNGAGFHQTLDYELRLQQISSKLGCSLSQVVLVQPLPVEVFADPYQLSQLAPLTRLNTSVQGRVDLESPAPVCRPTTLSIQLPKAQLSEQQLHVQVPLHARYPSTVARSGEGVAGSLAKGAWWSGLASGMAEVIFPAPVLLVECASGRQGQDQAVESWHELRATEQAGLVWRVPAGAQDQAEDVNLGTVVSVVVAMVVLLAALLSRDMK